MRVALVCAVGLALAPAALAAPTPLDLSTSASQGAAPLRVTLTAAADVTWDFGDGSSGAGASVEHVYQRPGLYVATATAADGTRSEVAVAAFALSLRAPAIVDWNGRLRLTGRLEPALVRAPLVVLRGGEIVALSSTDAAGAYSIGVRARTAGGWEVRYGDVVSARAAVTVRPKVDARLAGSGAVGERLRVVAGTRPAGAGALRVVVRRGGRTVADRRFAGTASLPLATGTPTAYTIRVSLEPTAGYAAQTRSLAAVVVQPNLSTGARGASVRALESRLRELRYAIRGVDGYYGYDTFEAVLAFQKVHGLARTGRVDASLWRALRAAQPPPARYPGDHIEVSKGRQVLFVVRDGRVTAAVHVSTGATGNTPLGKWQVYRKVPGWDWVLWYPMYFLRGFAIHGYPSVPAYPASHGCVRVPMWIAPQLYADQPHGRTIYVYW